MDEALLHEETTMSFVDLPSELIRTENFEHLVQFLQSMQPGQKIRIQTKYKKLTEQWKMATAIREKNSFTIQYDGRSNCDLTYDDADEEHSLISVNNWEIGWYGIVKEMCAASPKEQQDSSGMEVRKDGGDDADIPIKWGQFELTGRQTMLHFTDENSSYSYRLYSKVCIHGKEFLEPKKVVEIHKQQCFLFYFAAVPFVNGALEEDPHNYSALVYNPTFDEIQFAALDKVQPIQKPMVLNVDVAKAQKACQKFLANPAVVPFQTSRETGKNKTARVEKLVTDPEMIEKYEHTKQSSANKECPSPAKRKSNLPSRYALSPVKIGRFTYNTGPKKTTTSNNKAPRRSLKNSLQPKQLKKAPTKRSKQSKVCKKEPEIRKEQTDITPIPRRRKNTNNGPTEKNAAASNAQMDAILGELQALRGEVAELKAKQGQLSSLQIPQLNAAMPVGNTPLSSLRLQLYHRTLLFIHHLL